MRDSKEYCSNSKQTRTYHAEALQQGGVVLNETRKKSQKYQEQFKLNFFLSHSLSFMFFKSSFSSRKELAIKREKGM